MTAAPSPPPRIADLVGTVLALCRLRSGPQEIAYSPNLLGTLVGASTALDLVVASLLQEADNALLRSIASTALMLGLCWTALAVRRKSQRFVQTAIALVACSMLFSLVQVPIWLLAGPPPDAGAAPDAFPALLGWLLAGLLLWKLSVDAHVLRQALEVPFGLAFALATAWLIAYWALDAALFGAAP